MRIAPWVALVAAMLGAVAQAAPRRPVSAASLVRPGDRVYGNPHGSVTIVDFYDTSCGPCRILNRRLDRLVAHDPDVRYVPVNVPILGARSVIGARALVAAGRQGRRRAMLDVLMKQARLPTVALMRADAARLGLDRARFARDIDRAATTRAVAAELRRGTDAGIDYVPVVYVGWNRIPGAMSYRDLLRLVRHPDLQVTSAAAGLSAGF